MLCIRNCKLTFVQEAEKARWDEQHRQEEQPANLGDSHPTGISKG